MFLVSLCRGLRTSRVSSFQKPVMAVMARCCVTSEPAVEPKPSKKTNRSVYVGNLAYKVTWQDLKKHMSSKDGLVENVDILTNSTGSSMGCAVVTFATENHAKNAIKKLHDTELMGRLIFVREDREAEKKPRKASNKTIYVNNLPPKAEWQELKDYFRTIGTITRADVVKREGLGIVTYSTAEEAAEAVATLNNSQMMGQTLSVRYAADEK